MAITDLTGTTWVLNDSSIAGLSFSYSIDYNISEDGISKSQTVFASGNVVFQPEPTDPPTTINYLQGSNTTGTAPMIANTLGLRYFGTTFWQIDDATISITGGIDVTNPNLIFWLEENATNVTPVPSTGISIGASSLAKAFAGTSEVQKIIYNGIRLF